MPPPRPTAALLLAALLLAVPGGRAGADDHSIPLAVGDQGFSPAEVEAPAGVRVRFEVTNRAASAVEFESFDLNRERVIQPGQTVNVYVSGLLPGRYEFFDDFRQERRGTLVVK